MIRTLLTLFILASGSLHAECIFVNLNDAQEEINACKQGLQDKAMRVYNETGRAVEPEGLIQVDGVAGDAMPDDDGSPHSKTYDRLRQILLDPKNQGRHIDCIVISGEDGSGHFFGGANNFYAADLRRLYAEFPQLKNTLNASALWGCYPTSVHGAEMHWIKKIPAIQFAMGFTIQGPNKTREANHDLLRQFCDRREDGAKATSMDALCQFYDSLRQITSTSLGLCNRQGVASLDYGEGKPDHCFTYDQLHERCTEFIQNWDALENTYEQYRQGLRDDFETSPNGGISDLRDFYNKLQLWRHCTDKLKEAKAAAGQTGFEMPYAPDVIRLIKFKKLLHNIKEMNGPELRQYDIMLNNLGLGAYRLGDIEKLPRREMMARLQGAVSAIEQLAGGANQITVETQVATQASPTPAPAAAEIDTSLGFFFGGNSTEKSETAAPAVAPVVTKTEISTLSVNSSNGMVNGIELTRALRVAQCFRMALEPTDFRCTPFAMVGDNPGQKSVCIMGYERAKKHVKNDPC